MVLSERAEVFLEASSCERLLGSRPQDYNLACGNLGPECKSQIILHFMTLLAWGHKMEGHLGFEPRTRGLRGRCSNQLS